MRILIVNHTPLDGSGTGIYSRTLADIFTSKGHATAALAPVTASRLHVTFRYHEIGVPGHGRRWDLPFDFPSFSGHPESPRLYTDLTDAQVESYVRVWTEALAEVSSEFEPGIVHVNHAFLLAGVASRVLEAPYVVITHGSEFLRIAGDRFLSATRDGVLGADALIASTSATRALLQERVPLPDSAFDLINSGYDPSIFHPRPVDRDAVLANLGRDPSKPCVGYLGRIVPYKRPVDLLRALALLPADERPEAVVMGGGPLLAELRTEARRCGVTGVTFTGNISDRERIADVLSALDVVVVLGENEPYSVSALEALACGTPVLVSDGCGVTDVVDDAVGAVFPVGDVEVLAELIRTALSEDWQRLRRPHCVSRVADTTWEAIAGRTLELYERVLERRDVDAPRARAYT